MSTLLNHDQLLPFLKKIKLPQNNSRKGDNGKLLIIGGSHLFHAASRWSLDVSSKLVDMIFYASVPGNNQLIQKAKSQFWNGIVIQRNQIEEYLGEADCILIGPGMERSVTKSTLSQNIISLYLDHPPTDYDWNNNTQIIVNYLLAKYPTKKWVIDAGALQMLNPELLTTSCIITPHHKEMEMVLNNSKTDTQKNNLYKSTILLKGEVDEIIHDQEKFYVSGGNPGMTKGGTGDVLAGLVAGLYTNNEILPSAVVASYINKKAGESLYKKSGPFFNATDLVEEIPQVLWGEIKEINSAD